MDELRFRQVHLDFHTSEHIAEVAAEFDPDEFADTLKAAHVNSVTCFAHGQHGWLYYDSKRFPDRVHPKLLRRNLLAEQIEACHKRDIRVPIYITVQWDGLVAAEHPQWLARREDGEVIGPPLTQAGFNRLLCLSSPYRQFITAIITDVLESLPVDGLFIDIVQTRPCSCDWCRSGMEKAGLDPSRADDRLAYAIDMIGAFRGETTELIRRHDAGCGIFYNSGHIGPLQTAAAGYYTHFELESLPSGEWGYMHFPATARYARNFGLDILGMTGRFHTSWGDFHSFKNPAALACECFMALALGAKCSIGDQLNPSGRICRATYQLVGSVYEQVELAEPWCRCAEPVTEIGVLTPEEFGPPEGSSLHPALLGATRILQEGAHQFDVIDSTRDFARYRMLILPDDIPVCPKLAGKLADYLAGGGSLVATFRSGLNKAGDAFALDALGVKLRGEAPFCPDFIMPAGRIGESLPATEHVMYMRGLEVEPAEAQVLVNAMAPYFNRTPEHFCSHAHAPSSGRAAYPGIVRNGEAIYFAHPIFSQYSRNAPLWCKRLMLNAIEMLGSEPLLRHDGPSSIVATVNDQPADGRWIVHLLHYIPERRGEAFDVIEDVIPVHELGVSVRAEKKVSDVRCVPQDRPLKFTVNQGRVQFTLPRLRGHQMVALRYAD